MDIITFDNSAHDRSETAKYHERIQRSQSDESPFREKQQHQSALRTGSLGVNRKTSEEDRAAWNRQNLQRRTGLSTTPVPKRSSKSRLSCHLEEEEEDITSDSSEESRPSLESSGLDNIDLPSCSHGTDRHADRLVINVGGMRHETFRSTLKIFPDTRLGWIATNGSESIDAFDPLRNEYFFDRHPTAFSQILNFYRTGKLHSPTDICGPLFEEELSYWGLEEKSMEPCCWPKYHEHRDAQENLKVFDSPALNLFDDDDIDQKYDQEAESASNKNFHKLFRVFKPRCFETRKWSDFKKRIWCLFEDHSDSASFLSKVVSKISLTFILLSVLSLCFHSMVYPYPVSKPNNRTVNQLHSDILFGVDIVSVSWFTAEFTLRLISSPNRLSFMYQLLNIVDLLTIIQYYIQISKGRENYIFQNKKNENILEILSVARLFRLFRFFRLSTGLEILKHTMIASSKELLLLLLLLAIPVAIFATIVYYCERNTDETDFKTIPESLWWAIITMTTVGYGDMSPKTTQGKVFGALCATCSVLILALPVSIIGNNFTLFYHYAQARLKLPKRQKNAMVGAANALVAEPSQHSLSPDEDDESDNENEHTVTPRDSLKLEPDFIGGDDVAYSKRYRRERLSLYVSGPSRPSNRRSRSMGNFVQDSQRRSSNIKSRKNNGKHKKPSRTQADDGGDVTNIGSENLSFENENPVIMSNKHGDDDVGQFTFHNVAMNKENNQLNSIQTDVESTLQETTSTTHFNTPDPSVQPPNNLYPGSTGQLGKPTEAVDLPATVVTDCNVGEEKRFTEEEKLDALERNGKLNHKFHSPPILKRNGTIEAMTRKVSEDCVEYYEPERRKPSNNHLYVPPSVGATAH